VRDPVTLEARLARDARRFELIQALRLIECVYRDAPRIGASLRARDDPVRLGQDAELAFCGAQITGYEPAAGGKPARLAVNFGLLGTDGPMPLHFTEYVRERLRHAGDKTWSSFLDVFHHRMASLLYRAWSASEPVIGLDRKDDEGFSRYVGSLCGFGSTMFRRGEESLDEARLGFCAILGAKTRSAEGLARLLSHYFAVPVAVEPFAGQWLRLPGRDCTRLASADGPLLGKGLVLGSRVWDRQHALRVVIGPLQAEESRRFLPGTRTFATLVGWIRMYTTGLLDCAIALRLAPGAASPMRLARNARIGRDAWLGGPVWSATRSPVLRFSTRAAARHSR
jgi:type VI secretion system protein ImpH